MPAPPRYLILRLSALGDVVFALETLAALKAARPEARVDWCVEDRCAELLRGHPQIDRLLVFPRRALAQALRHPWRALRALCAHVRALRQERYDGVLDLHGNFKSGLHLRATRARAKLSYGPPAAREGSWHAATEVVALPTPLPHRAERGLFQVRALGLSAEPAPLALPADPGTGAALWRSAAGAGPKVALVPGTSVFGAFKRWPADRYGQLANELVAARDARVAVCFGPGEEPLFEAIRAVAGARVLAVPGAQVGLPGLLSVLRGADLVIGGDTGPVHMAAAAGTRVLALYGPKDPARYGPRGAHAAVLRNAVPCSPCTLRRCPAPLCILGIHTRDVAARALALLGERTRG